MCRPRLAFALFALASCTNVSTLQTATPLAPGTAELSGQAWGVLEPSTGRYGVFPAISWRQGAGPRTEIGTRLTYLGNVQLDGKAALHDGRLSLAIGFGLGTDLVSFLLATNNDDRDNNVDALTLDVFAPFIASYDVIPDFLSVHGTLRPQLWLVPRQSPDVVSQFIFTGAVGLRAGKDYGVHAEAMPLLASYAGFNWAGAASLFVRFEN